MGTIKTLSRQNLERINYDLSNRFETADLQEKIARELADSQLSTAINEEADTRAEADSLLSGLLTDEVDRAKAAESALDGKISKEASDREAADNDIIASIEAKAAELQSAIEAEAQVREEGDTSLDGKITAETSRATEKENELSQAIALEQSRAEGVEEELSDAVTQEISDREYYDNEERTAREAEISRLDTALEVEKTAREGKDSELEAAIQKEVSDREASIDTVKEEYIAADTRDLAVAKAYADNVFTERIVPYRSSAEQDEIDEAFAEKEHTYTKEEVDSLLEGSGKVQDVQVNGESVLEGKDAIIKLKTINGTAITGEGDLTVGGVTPEEKALIDTIPSKADKTELASVSSVVSETQVLLRREVEAREGLSEFVGDTPLSTTAQTISSAINELKAGGSVEEWTLAEIQEIFG